MAKSSVIGALRVNLGLDSAQFQTGLKNSQSQAAAFSKRLATAFAAVTAAGVAMAGAVAVGIKRTIDEADGLSKASQKFGVPVDALARLKHAADLSGVSMEGLGTGIRVLSRNMAEFANGAKNSASQAFQQLGIDVKNADGSLKSSSQVMTEIAGKFAGMENGAQKTALSMALFGRSGADLIPMLNAGATGLADMMAEADQLGIVLDERTGRAAEAFNDNLTRMGRVKDGLYLKITAELLPSLELLSERFLGFANDEDAVRAAADGITSSIGWISEVIGGLVTDIGRARAEITGLVQAIKLLGSGEFSGAIAAFGSGQAESDRILQEYKDRVAAASSGIVQSQGQIARRIDAAFGEAGDSAGETFLEAIETKMGGGGRRGGGGGRVRAALDPLAAEASRIFEQTRTPVERYQAAIARLNELLAAGAINQDTYNRAVEQAQDAFDRAENAGKKAEGTFEGIGQSISQSFSSAFQGLIDGSKKVGDVLRDLMSQLSSMLLNNAFKAIFDAGGSGGGFFSGLMKAIGFRANGGAVMAGRPYLVGERGPELMIPGTSGSVVSNADLARGGKGQAQNVHVTVSVDDDGKVQAYVSNMGRQAAQAGAAVAVNQVKNGFPSMLANAQSRSL